MKKESMRGIHPFTLPDNLLRTMNQYNWEKEIAQLRGVWETGKKVLLICGPSDTGKTELGITFGQQVCSGNTYLVCYKESLCDTIADLPLMGYMQIPTDWSLSQETYRKQRFDEKCQILQHFYSNALFIIDGVDAKSIQQEPEYARLMKLNVRFVFTSQRNCDGGADIFLSKKTHFAQMILARLTNLTQVQRRILCCATLLSDYGLQKNRFLECLSVSEKDEVDPLLDNGLLSVSPNESIAIRPDVREKYKLLLRPTDADCADFLDELARYVEPVNCFSPLEYRQVAACFVNASEHLLDKTGKYAHYAAQMLHDSGDYIPRFPFLEKWLSSQLALQPCSELDLARALCEAGAANWFQAVTSPEKEAKHALKDQAIQRIREGVSLYEINLGPCHPDVAEARMALADYLLAQDPIAADALAQETLENQLAVLPEDDPSLCAVYLSYATHHYHWYDRKIRLEYASKAVKIMEGLDYAHRDLSLAYRVLSECADTKEQCLEYASEALKVCCTQTPWNQNRIYKSLIWVAELNKSFGRYTVQKQYLMQAINLLEEILPPEHPLLVKHYGEMKTIEEHDD